MKVKESSRNNPELKSQSTKLQEDQLSQALFGTTIKKAKNTVQNKLAQFQTLVAQ